MESFKFSDIMYAKYPDFEIERDFPDRILRAAQFAPFAALTGYDDAVMEAARQTENKLELDEYIQEELNRKLGYLNENINCMPEITVEYFVPDAKKAGGKYVAKTGKLRKICEYEQDIIFDDGLKIAFNDILHIESRLFSDIV